jgi:hypothetical protein
MHFSVSARPQCQEWKNMKRYLWLLALPAIGAAQVAPVEVAAPTLGYVWEDQARALLPVEGVPGSAALGSPLHLGVALETIAIAPGRRLALGQESGSDSLLVIRLDGAIGSAQRSELPKARVSFSPSSSTVALTFGDRVEVWSNVQTQPRRGQTFSSGGADLQQVFVSDDGDRVLALSGGSLYRLTPNGAAELIGEGFRDVVFLKNSEDAIAAHATRGIVMLRKGTDTEELISAVESPMSIATSADEQRIAVLVDGSVLLIDRQSTQVVGIVLHGIAVSGMTRAQGNAVFQLITENGGAIWFVDGDSAEPRLVAVTKGEMQ